MGAVGGPGPLLLRRGWPGCGREAGLLQHLFCTDMVVVIVLTQSAGWEEVMQCLRQRVHGRTCLERGGAGAVLPSAASTHIGRLLGFSRGALALVFCTPVLLLP